MFIKNGEILLARRTNTGFEDANYGLIGGHLAGHETVKQAAMRECHEEIGVSIAAVDLDVIGVEHYVSPTGEGIDFYCKANRWQGEPYARAECDNITWFKLDNLPKTMIPFMRDAIARYLSEQSWFSGFEGNDFKEDSTSSYQNTNLLENTQD